MGKFYLNKKIAVVCAVLVAGLSSTACNQGSGLNVKIDGVDGPYVTFVNNTFMMTTTLKNVSFEGGITLPLPHTEHSFFEVGPDFQSAGTLIRVGIAVDDLKFLKNNLNLLQPNTLPGGRPLPGVVAGVLPSIAIQVPKLDNAVFYIGPEVFGVFVPVRLGMQGAMGSFRFYDAQNDPIGVISIVGEDSNKTNSGILLLLSLKGKVAEMAGL